MKNGKSLTDWPTHSLKSRDTSASKKFKTMSPSPFQARKLQMQVQMQRNIHNSAMEILRISSKKYCMILQRNNVHLCSTSLFQVFPATRANLLHKSLQDDSSRTCRLHSGPDQRPQVLLEVPQRLRDPTLQMRRVKKSDGPTGRHLWICIVKVVS